MRGNLFARLFQVFEANSGPRIALFPEQRDLFTDYSHEGPLALRCLAR